MNEIITTSYTPTNIDGIDGRCNALLRTCKNPQCDYAYKNAEETACPQCSTPRELCSQYPSKGRNRCRFHGGASLRGIAHPNYQGKGKSLDLPTRMMDSYEAHLTDPNILDLTNFLAMLKSRLEDLASRADDAVSRKQWGEAKKAMKNLRKANTAAKMIDAQNELEKVLAKGYYDSLVWDEINSTLEQLRKLIETESKRREKAATIITEKQFRTLLGYVINSVKTRVSDEDEKMAILSDLQRLNL